jgi:hypothetical protein
MVNPSAYFIPAGRPTVIILPFKKSKKSSPEMGVVGSVLSGLKNWVL